MADADLGGEEEIQFLCVVPQCHSRGTQNVMFRMTKNSNLEKQWRELIFRPEKMDWTTARVCVNHFLERDYFEHNGRMYLVDGALPSLNLPGQRYRRDVCDCIKSKPEVRAVDCQKISLINNRFCCLCTRQVASGKRTILGDKYTDFGKKMLYFIVSLKRNLQISSFCCHKCARKVEKTFTKIMKLVLSFLRTTMTASGLDLDTCPACGELWDMAEETNNHFEEHVLKSSLNNLSEFGAIPEFEPAEMEYKNNVVADIFNYSIVRFHYEFGKWNPIESRKILDHAKEQQRFRTFTLDEPGERLSCCICNGPRGEMFYILDATNSQIGVFGKIFDQILFAPEKKSSKYMCEYCTAILMDLFGDYMYLNVKSLIACRRANGESLEYALRRGCFQNNCDFIAGSLKQLCTHMAGHF